MRNTSTCRLIIRLLAVVLGWSVGWPQGIPAQETYSLTVLLTTGDLSMSPAINADGTRIVFQSSVNLTGQNPDGNAEVFLYETATSAPTQLTTTITGSNTAPAINADGTRIAFQSNADLTGQNLDGNTEIFVYDTTTSTLTQVTATATGLSFDPAINADGTRITFWSNTDPLGENPEGNFEIFVYDTTTSTLTQVTDAATGFSFDPAINADGTRIIFWSVANLTAQNATGQEQLLQATSSSGPPPPSDPECGNGVVESGEGCDGAVSGATCETFAGPGASGTLLCTDTCTIDSSNCVAASPPDGPECGNGVVESGEECDGAVSGLTCEAFAGAGALGFVFCTSTCTIDSSHCGVAPPPPPGGPECGNGVVESGEECDGAVSGVTCEAFAGAGASGFVFCADTCTVDSSKCALVPSPGPTPPLGPLIATLENPQPNSYQNGIGVISGWACAANRIEVVINGTETLEAAYGSSREDTRSVCGDANNGFGLLFNWSLLGDGQHVIRVLADGVEFAQVTVAVTTFGVEFLLGASGEFSLPSFPVFGHTTSVSWQESLQNFVIHGPESGSGGNSGNAAAVLENPAPGSFQSGIGVLSGWVCQAARIEIEIDGVNLLEAGYGTSRQDTQSVCGDADNGFGLLINWNLLGDGVHTVRARADGIEFASANIFVTTFGTEFLPGVSGEFFLANFPQQGESTRILWQESLQNFVIVKDP